MTVGTHPDTPRNLGRAIKVWQDDILTAKELAACEKEPDLKKTVEQLVIAIGRGILVLKAFIKKAPRLSEMTSARSSFIALGYNMPAVLEKQFALKSLAKIS